MTFWTKMMFWHSVTCMVHHEKLRWVECNNVCEKKKIQWAARKLHSVACKMTNAQDFLSYDSNLGIYRHVQKSTNTSSSWIFSYVIHYVWKLPVKLTVIVFEAMKVMFWILRSFNILRPTEVTLKYFKVIGGLLDTSEVVLVLWGH